MKCIMLSYSSFEICFFFHGRLVLLYSPAVADYGDAFLLLRIVLGLGLPLRSPWIPRRLLTTVRARSLRRLLCTSRSLPSGQRQTHPSIIYRALLTLLCHLQRRTGHYRPLFWSRVRRLTRCDAQEGVLALAVLRHLIAVIATVFSAKKTKMRMKQRTHSANSTLELADAVESR